ncbi:MAG: ABC transporter permease subunit, partial [Acidothermaceae bacterium]
MVWVNAIVQGLMLGGLFALFACGLSLLFGVVGVINLAHGDLAVLGAYVAVAILPSVHTNALWALLFVPPIFAVFGYGAQRTILQRSLASGPLTTLLVTFGLSVVIQNALLEGFSADSHSLSIGALATSAFHPVHGLVVPYLRLAILLAAILVLGAV